MESQLKQLRIATFSELSPQHLKAVKRFIMVCGKYDGYEPIFYWNNIEHRKNKGQNDLIVYNDANEIIAYLALYHFEENEVEITLMVAPEYRQPSFYAMLLEQVKQMIASYPVNISHFVFTCNQKDKALKKYIQGLAGNNTYTVHKMALTVKRFSKLRAGGLEFIPMEHINIRRATFADLVGLVRLDAECYGFPSNIYHEKNSEILENPHKRIMVAVKNNKVIGKMNILFDKKYASLYDLCIAPEERGNGYAAVLLQNIFKTVFELGMNKILLDAEDELHMQWYQKLNFTCKASYEQWKVEVPKDIAREHDKQVAALFLNYQCHHVQDQMSLSTYKH